MKQVYPVTIQSGAAQTGNYILTLHEPEGGIQVPVIIGHNEAQCILLAKNPEESGRLRRPMTHQMLMNIMEQYGLTLIQVTIDRVLEGVFYATLHISDGFNERAIDSRTTDAITLALLSDAPIYMDERVLAETGVTTRKPQASEQPTLEELEEELHRCEEAEDYERAAEIQTLIDKLKQ